MYCTPADVEARYGAAFLADHGADAAAVEDACTLANGMVSAYMEAAVVPLIGPGIDGKVQDCATAIAAHRLCWTAGVESDDVWLAYLGGISWLKQARDGKLPEQVALLAALEEDHEEQE